MNKRLLVLLWLLLKMGIRVDANFANLYSQEFDWNRNLRLYLIRPLYMTKRNGWKILKLNFFCCCCCFFRWFYFARGYWSINNYYCCCPIMEAKQLFSAQLMGVYTQLYFKYYLLLLFQDIPCAINIIVVFSLHTLFCIDWILCAQ